MRQAGCLKIAGPLDDQPDASWRGICLYQVGLFDGRLTRPGERRIWQS